MRLRPRSFGVVVAGALLAAGAAAAVAADAPSTQPHTLPARGDVGRGAAPAPLPARGDVSRGAAPVPLPLGVHLLVDGVLLASTVNVSFELGAPVKEGPAIRPGALPWEASIGFYASALACPAAAAPSCGAGEFRAYYACGGDPVRLCVANSSDGRAWAKPLSRAFTWDGTRVVPGGTGAPTNVVFLTNDSVSFPGSVFIDDAPGVPAAERFKLTYEGAGAERLLFLATSPDGLAFAARSPEVPIIAERLFSDTDTAIVADSASGTPTWTAFGRKDATFDNDTTACAGAYPTLRRVLAAVSTVSAAGPYAPSIEVVTPGLPDDPVCLDDYNPAPFVVAGTTFLQVSQFRHFSVNDSGATGPAERINDGVLDIRLAFTRASPPVAGVAFSASRDAFIGRGVGTRDPATGAFSLPGSDLDAGMVFSTAGGLLDPDALATPASAAPRSAAWPLPYSAPSPYVRLVYFAAQFTHTGGRYLANGSHTPHALHTARLRREGLVGLRTARSDAAALGAAETVALAPPACGAGAAPWLLFNVETAVGGGVRAEARDAASGSPLPGFALNASLPIIGNAIRAPVGWLSGGGARGGGRGVEERGAVGGGDPPVPPPASYALPAVPFTLFFELRHATLWAWDVQCVDESQ